MNGSESHKFAKNAIWGKYLVFISSSKESHILGTSVMKWYRVKTEDLIYLRGILMYV